MAPRAEPVKEGRCVTAFGNCAKTYDQHDNAVSLPSISVDCIDKGKRPDSSEGQCSNSKHWTEISFFGILLYFFSGVLLVVNFILAIPTSLF